MRPDNFPESTKTLTAPPNMPECGELPVWTNGEQCVSCWRPTWRERLSVLLFGRVWVAIWFGETQPPVAVTGCRKYFRPILPQILKVVDK